MRHRLICGWLGIIAGALVFPAAAPAQYGDNSSVPSQPSVIAHIPTGNPGSSGFWVASEFVFLTQSRSIGDQIVAFRGFFDAQGLVAGGTSPQEFGKQLEVEAVVWRGIVTRSGTKVE